MDFFCFVFSFGGGCCLFLGWLSILTLHLTLGLLIEGLAAACHIESPCANNSALYLPTSDMNE